MNAAEQAVKLFETGVPVRDVEEMVEMSRAVSAGVPIHFAKYPKYSGGAPTAGL